MPINNVMYAKATVMILLIPFAICLAQDIPCDFNGNDYIDIHDITSLINRLNHVAPFDTLPYYWAAGDCDCDSAHLTVADLFSLTNRLIYGIDFGRGQHVLSTVDTLLIADSPASPGQLISIPVALTTADSINGFQFYIRYDPQVVEFISLAVADSLGDNGQPYIIDGGVAQYFPLPHPRVFGSAIAWLNLRINPGVTPPLDTYILFADNPYLAVYSGLARVDLDAAPPDSDLTFIRPVKRMGHITITETSIADDGIENGKLSLDILSNPVNSEFLIRIYSPTEAFIDLSIFDILGRRVTALIQNEMVSGSREIVWNPSGLVSGIYFVRLVSQDERLTRKITLLK